MELNTNLGILNPQKMITHPYPPHLFHDLFQSLGVSVSSRRPGKVTHQDFVRRTPCGMISGYGFGGLCQALRGVESICLLRASTTAPQPVLVWVRGDFPSAQIHKYACRLLNRLKNYYQPTNIP